VEIARRIKRAVRGEIGLTVSAGVAPSKFVAKIASDMEKPDGLTVVPPERVREFLDPLPVKKMWGAGKVTQEALARLRIHTFRDLRSAPMGVLEAVLGEHGRRMHHLSQGIDERDVIPEHDAKSIGREETFLTDITDLEEARRELLSLAYRVARRMRRSEARGKTVTLKVKYHDFTLATRSETLSVPTDDGQEIYAATCRLLVKTGVGKRPVRLLGISLTHLEFSGEVAQLPLFGPHSEPARKEGLHRALDTLYEKHGDKGIRPGRLVAEK
jgi:DNA polymerase-4